MGDYQGIGVTVNVQANKNKEDGRSTRLHRRDFTDRASVEG
jgi:hypothetical protein